MYASQMFAKILLRITTSKVWKAALSVTSEKDPLDHVWRTDPNDWMVSPPLPTIVFAGTLTINALRCCAAGGDQSRVPMDEPSHRQIYAELLAHVERDWNSPALGEQVKLQIEKALNGIM
jgi:hypothetical protein